MRDDFRKTKKGKTGSTAIIVLLVLLIGGLLVWRYNATRQLKLPYLTASSIVVTDCGNGRKLYQKNEEYPQSPASLTKLMTLLLIMEDLEAGRLTWDDTFTVMPEQAYTPGSKYGMNPGEVFSVRQLVAGVILASGCDCVQCLVQMSAGNESDFVDRMNQKAQELGLKGSRFANATGIDTNGHYMTAKDISLLSKLLIDTYPEVLDMSSQKELTIEDRVFSNINQLVVDDERVIGLKTGTSTMGGYSLVTVAERDGRRSLIVLMNSNNKVSRYKETETILNAIYGENF